MVSEGMGTVLFGHGGMQTKIVQLAGRSADRRGRPAARVRRRPAAGHDVPGPAGRPALDRAGPDDRPGPVHDPAHGPRPGRPALARPVFELPIGGNAVSVDPQAYVGHHGMIDTKLATERSAGATWSAAARARRSRSSAPAGHRLRPGLGDEVLMSITTYNPNTLPVDDNINAYSFCVDLNGQCFLQKGKMIAYYGQMKFESLQRRPALRADRRALLIAAVRERLRGGRGQRQDDHRRPRVRHQLLRPRGRQPHDPARRTCSASRRRWRSSSRSSRAS